MDCDLPGLSVHGTEYSQNSQYSPGKNTEAGCHFFLQGIFPTGGFFFSCGYYLKKIIYCNWRLITLQYCIGFAIHWHESATGAHVSSHPEPPSHTPSPSHPSGFECPVSCIELGLVIYFTYGNIHVSLLFSQIIPPLPSHTESKSLFFISVTETGQPSECYSVYVNIVFFSLGVRAHECNCWIIA